MSTYIPVHDDIWTNRKTLLLALALDLPPMMAAAHMIHLWHWSVENAEDGSLAAMPPVIIAAGAAYQGDAEAFVAALRQAGFLDGDGTIHDWDEHCGRLVAARQRNRVRKQRERAGSGTEMERDVTRTSRGRHAPIEEKSREENSTAEESTTVVVAGTAGGGHGGGASHPGHIAEDVWPEVERLLAVFPECRRREHPVLATIVRNYPGVALVAEAQKCRAYYRRPPGSWAKAFSQWITGGRQVLLLDGRMAPPQEGMDPIDDLTPADGAPPGEDVQHVAAIWRARAEDLPPEKRPAYLAHIEERLAALAGG